MNMKNDSLIKFIKEDVRKILSEGGLWGHMSHLYENVNLSFSELKEVFDLATDGKLENVTEKTDGQNIFFSYNLKNRSLRFARNQGHIKSGGIAATEIIEKWNNIPHIKNAYYNAYIILSKAIESLPEHQIEEIFGSNANIWYSAEVIYTGSPNVINYDKNTLAIHEGGAVFDENGKPLEDRDVSRNFAILNSVIGFMQEAVEESGWTLMGPVVLEMQKALNKNAGKIAGTNLMQEIGKYGLAENDLIKDYVAKKFALYAKGLQPDLNDRQMEILGKIFSDDSKPNAQKKKEALMVSNNPEIEKLFLAKNEPKILKSIISPIEKIVHEFAVDILEDVHSVIALNPSAEVKRLRAVVADEIEKIKSLGDEKSMQFLSTQLDKLQSVERITSSLEGIVFRYKGQTYKLTGNFAPINAILGLLRFAK